MSMIRFPAFIFAVMLAAVPLVLQAADQGAIAPGDTLRITVLGEPDYSKQVLVDDNGNIALPLAKDIHVAGMTTAQASSAIAGQLGKFIKSPDVTVELVQKVRKQVTLAGQVRTPGVYPVEGETRLMEVVGLAGGFTETADTTKVSVTRRGSPEPVNCDLQAFLAGSNLGANVILQDGDVILVPDRSPTIGTVFVYGAVRTPGQPIQIRDGMRISQAVSAAGGIIPEQADQERAILKRAGQPDSVKIDLAKALTGDPNADMILQSGDTITVPTASGTFTIYGAVATSGQFPVRDKMTISKALAAAGGPTQRAKITELRITRTGDGGGPQSIPVNMKRVADGKSADVPVQVGDTIYVPEQSDRPDMTRVLGLGVALLSIFLRN